VRPGRPPGRDVIDIQTDERTRQLRHDCPFRGIERPGFRARLQAGRTIAQERPPNKSEIPQTAPACDRIAKVALARDAVRAYDEPYRCRSIESEPSG
jgi:hypothetical protein